MSRWPHGCHNSRAGEPAPAYRRYDRFSTDSSGHRCRVASSVPATQQPASVRSVALSGRAVASQRRSAISGITSCFSAHVVSSLAYPNLPGTRNLDCCWCCCCYIGHGSWHDCKKIAALQVECKRNIRRATSCFGTT
jgi:hypothetical protein